MVATRRGVRVSSPTKTNPDQSSDVQATPSTARRTRSSAKPAESLTQQALVETCNQLEKLEGEAPESPSVLTRKRCTRASRLHSPEQPCTPVGSHYEGDMSDMESCCSVVSDIEPPVTRSTRRRRQPLSQDEEISEVESCSSAVSASKPRRSTRRKALPESSDTARVEVEDVKVDLALETESCNSAVSESQRVTRSQRRTARTRSAAKQQTEDSELSDADSYISSVSGAEVSKSTTRRDTRSRRQMHPIPMQLDEPSESCQSPVSTSRRTRAARGKTVVDVSEPPSCDSEGFESGPTYSMTTRRRGKTQSAGSKVVDSESDVTDVHSPVGSPTRGRGTPCSSRTGSGNSSRGAPASRRSVKDFSVVVENAEEHPVEDTSLNDSRLESTVIADCTLLEEEKSQISEEQEGVNNTDLTSSEAGGKEEEEEEKKISVILEEESLETSSAPAVSEPAVMATDQQEEPSAENKDVAVSEMEVMQETVPSSEPVKPCQSVTVTVCEKASDSTETEEKQGAVDAADEDAQPSQEEKPLDEEAAVETRPSVEEQMEVSTLTADAQQVVESIQVTSSHEEKVTVGSDSEQQHEDVVVQNTKAISLLDSSDEEDEYSDEEEEEEREVSEEEGLRYKEEEERGEPSKKSEPAAASVEGLFMVDTRPGQEADEHYYKEALREEGAAGSSKGAEQQQQEEDDDDEEFVDEEGGSDDDEESEVLFTSRDPHLKELSSRIDPGIRVKELGGLYISFDGSKSKPVSSSLQKLKGKKIQDEVMKKSVMGPDFEKKDAVPPYSESKQALKLKHREEKAKSTGDGWFNMKAPELSQELKGDLQVLKMRGSLDPKRFYKKNDRDGFPKYFQVGTVVDNPVDFYHSRIPNKQRKRTMVEELLADAEFRHKNKKKYQQIITEKAAQGAGRRNKKKNKFHKK